MLQNGCPSCYNCCRKGGIIMAERNKILHLSIKAAILVSISAALTACSGLNSEFDPLKQQNKLKLPVILEDTNADPGVAEFSLEAQEGRTEFAEGFPADTIGYNGSYLGPVIRFSSGEKVTINVKNSLRFSYHRALARACCRRRDGRRPSSGNHARRELES